MVIYGEIAKQCQSIAIPCRYRVRSDMLLDNSGDDPQCNAVFLIQVGNGKADIILSSGSAPIIAGMCYGIGTVAKADIHNALMDMGDLPGIFALNMLFEFNPETSAGESTLCRACFSVRIAAQKCTSA